jgi:hypothetical protein
MACEPVLVPHQKSPVERGEGAGVVADGFFGMVRARFAVVAHPLDVLA